MKKMKMATRAKLFGILSIVLVVITLAITVLVKLAVGHLQDATTAQLNYTIYLTGLSDASAYLTDEARFCAATGEKTHYDNYWNEVNTAKNREANVAALQAMGLTAEEQALLDQVAALSNSLVPLEEKAMDLALSGKTQQAIAIAYGDEYDATAHQITETINALEESVLARARHDVDAQVIFVDIVSIASCVFLAVVLISVCILVTFTLRDLIVPIEKIRNAVLAFAEGNLDAEVKLKEDSTEVGETARAIHHFQAYQKEIISDMDNMLDQMGNGNFDIDSACPQNYVGNYSELLVSINRINRTLDRALKDIRMAAEQVDAGADQVAAGAQALSQGATEQASAVEELAATICDVNAQIQKTKEVADTARANATADVKMAGNSDSQIKEMLGAMDAISRSSEEIGRIIKAIEDIAFQTNILALNAAVEAARAGSAGKGFAVVADEVRNLAAKSAEASQSSAVLIDDSKSAVENGIRLANVTADILGHIADGARTAAGVVSGFAQSAEEQADSMNQISVGIDQISAVVQTNSATAEQSAAASEELSSQAAVLKDLVDRFKLRND